MQCIASDSIDIYHWKIKQYFKNILVSVSIKVSKNIQLKIPNLCNQTFDENPEICKQSNISILYFIDFLIIW